MCCRVLVVDDDSRFRQLARDVLEHRGCVVVGEAGTGAAARSAAERLAPDAVLLDVRLPDESGFEVCAALSETGRAPAVLLVSASDYAGCAVVALCGAKGFALKSDLVDIDLARYWPMPGAEGVLSRPQPR